jgi:hypothetical protein
LYDHLNTNNILVDEQFGFRENLSTETAIFTFLNKVLTSLNNKILVGGLFCDLQKAFDSMNHDILLSKMEFYGISDIMNKLMASYLHDRYQRVSIKDNNSNKYFSNWVHVKHGVPQGCVHKDSDVIYSLRQEFLPTDIRTGKSDLIQNIVNDIN